MTWDHQSVSAEAWDRLVRTIRNLDRPSYRDVYEIVMDLIDEVEE